MNKKTALFLAEGFEEIEALTVVDILRRAGIEITMVSVDGNMEVRGSHGIIVRADAPFDAVKFDETDMLILPGGKLGTQNLEKTTALTDKLLEFNSAGRLISAICAAPGIFGRLGILKGRKACCYPGCEEDSWEAEILTTETVTDGNVLTSRGMGTAIPFALEIVARFNGREAADAMARQIVFGQQ